MPDCSYGVAELLFGAGAHPTIEGWTKITPLQRAKERKKARKAGAEASFC